MALTTEDLQAIAELMDKKLDEKLNDKLKPIHDKLEVLDNRLEKVETRIEVLDNRQTVLTKKLEDIDFKLTNLEHTTKKEFAKINDEVETLIAVLEAKNILPRQA